MCLVTVSSSTSTMNNSSSGGIDGYKKNKKPTLSKVHNYVIFNLTLNTVTKDAKSKFPPCMIAFPDVPTTGAIAPLSL